MTHLERSLALLQQDLGDAVQAVSTFRGETEVVVDQRALVEACRLMRDQLEFEQLSMITASDSWPEEPRFGVVYQLHSLRQAVRLRLKVRLAGDEAVLPTVEEVYPNANWYEREIYDLFGVVFEGSHDLRRILMPEDWEGYPLRKDYPLGYEEVEFSFNFDEIERKKPYAKE